MDYNSEDLLIDKMCRLEYMPGKGGRIYVSLPELKATRMHTLG